MYETFGIRHKETPTHWDEYVVIGDFGLRMDAMDFSVRRLVASSRLYPGKRSPNVKKRQGIHPSLVVYRCIQYRLEHSARVYIVIMSSLASNAQDLAEMGCFVFPHELSWINAASRHPVTLPSW